MAGKEGDSCIQFEERPFQMPHSDLNLYGSRRCF